MNLRKYIEEAALRFDTIMSRAFLRALGISIPKRVIKSDMVVPVDDLADIEFCFRNTDSPMNGRLV